MPRFCLLEDGLFPGLSLLEDGFFPGLNFLEDRFLSLLNWTWLATAEHFLLASSLFPAKDLKSSNSQALTLLSPHRSKPLYRCHLLDHEISDRQGWLLRIFIGG